MDKVRILQEVRDDLSEAMQSFSVDTMKDITKQLEEYGKFVELLDSPLLKNGVAKLTEERSEAVESFRADLKSAVDAVTSNTPSGVVTPIVSQEKPSEEDLGALVDKFNKKKDVKGYKLERLVVGGRLNNKIYVSESIIRRLQVDHGDILTATYKGTDNGDVKYYFEVVERLDLNENKDIDVFPYGILEYNNEISSYVVTTNIYGQTLRIDEAPIEIRLEERDVEKMGLRLGEVIDIAWEKNKPETVKVRWLHRNMDYCGTRVIGLKESKECVGV